MTVDHRAGAPGNDSGRHARGCEGAATRAAGALRCRPAGM